LIFISQNVYANVLTVYNMDCIEIFNELKAGDTVFIKKGTYKLNTLIENNISLIGEEGVILIPSNESEPVIHKTGNGKISNIKIESGSIKISDSNAIFKNSIIQNSNKHGLELSFFKGIIENCIIQNNNIDGIKAYNSSGTVKNSIIRNNNDDGIHTVESRMTFDSVVIQNNKDNGIELWFDEGSVITNSEFYNNRNDVFNATEKFSTQPISKTITESKTDDTDFYILTDFINETKKLKISDFNLNYRNKSCSLEIPLFTKLYKMTLNTPVKLKEVSDYILENNIYDKINYLIENDSPSVESFNEYEIKYKKIKLPKYFPDELEEQINRIIYLTGLYEKELQNIKSNFSEEDFDFIVKNVTTLFDNENLAPKNIRERLEHSDLFNEKQIKLANLLRKLDLTTLKLIGNEIIFCSEKITEMDFSEIPSRHKKKEILFKRKTDFGEIIIAGNNDNRHINLNAFILIDIEGDDDYKNSIVRTNLEQPVSLYFDFGGNDYYYSENNFDLCSSIFGVSYLFNKSGNDKYIGKSHSIASTYFGISVLRDEAGNDFYEGTKYCIGAATFGIAILNDNAGNDIYQGGLYCQGFASVKGYGMIKEKSGNDYYLSGNTVIDSIRYQANSITMSQGFGFGIRPYLPGGLGMIVEGGGNDTFKADIFGQGGSYWKAIGSIMNYSGDDHYVAHRYAQGAGIHLSIGLLYDEAGNDNYSSYSVSQGIGHDLGYGMLYDKSGDDFYKNYHLGMGAGNANGIGILIDESGNDGYFGLGKTQGAGIFLHQRQFGSIGIFIDASGNDNYLKYSNDMIDLKDQYGIFYDKE
jgi:hypothetical protein